MNTKHSQQVEVARDGLQRILDTYEKPCSPEISKLAWMIFILKVSGDGCIGLVLHKLRNHLKTLDDGDEIKDVIKQLISDIERASDE